MNIIPFILQCLALISLTMATFGRGTIFKGPILSTFPLGMLLWLLSLMLGAILLHPIGH